MIKISRKTWRKSGVEVIVFKGKKLLNEMHIETQLGHSNLPAVTNKYSSKYKKQRQKLQNCDNYKPCRRFLKEAFPIHIMICNTTPAVFFRTKLGFKQHDPIMAQEQSILSKIMIQHASQKIVLQYSVIGCRADAYFPDHKLVAEVDEQGHKQTY